MNKLPSEAHAILRGRHSDPFRYLGRHQEGGHSVVRAFLPDASNVEVIDDGGATAPLACIHKGGLFSGEVPNGAQHYRLRARFGDNTVELRRARPCETPSTKRVLGRRRPCPRAVAKSR